MVHGITGGENQSAEHKKGGFGVLGGAFTAAAGAGAGYCASSLSSPCMTHSYYKGIVDAGEDAFVKTTVDDAVATAQRIGADVDTTKNSATTLAKDTFEKVGKEFEACKPKARNSKILFAAGGAALALGVVALAKKIFGGKTEAAEGPEGGAVMGEAGAMAPHGEVAEVPQVIQPATQGPHE